MADGIPGGPESIAQPPQSSEPSRSLATPTEAESAAEPAVDLRQLVADCYQDVYRYAYRLSGSAADAEDLTQQTFLMAQARWRQLREPEKALRWLFAIVRTSFLKSIRRARPMAVDPVELNLEDAVVRESGVVDEEALRESLAELPDDYRVVVLMFYFEELSYKEIGQQLEIPIGTVMSRLARAKSRLRAQLLDDELPPKPRGAGRPPVRMT